MKLCLTMNPGMALFTAFDDGNLLEGTCDMEVDGDITAIAARLGRQLPVLVRGTHATKPRATRGFSFHWSNAQAKWDVIAANDPTWSLDGAEFLVYFKVGALSPLGKSWTLKEMQYVAQRLPPHPGFSRAVMAARVVARFIAASPDRLDQQSAKAHGFELVGLFGWDNYGDDPSDDDDGYYDRDEDWSFRDADMILRYKGSEIGRMDMDSESAAVQLLKSLRGSKSVAEAIAVLTPLFQHDRTFRRFLQDRLQLTRGK